MERKERSSKRKESLASNKIFVAPIWLKLFTVQNSCKGSNGCIQLKEGDLKGLG